MPKQVIIQLKGGLGNQMFQYALGRHIALRNNAELLLDCSSLLNRASNLDAVFRGFDLEIFQIVGKVATEEDIPLFPKHVPTTSTWHHLQQFLKLKAKGFSYFYQSPKIPWSFRYDHNLLTIKSDKIYLNGYWQYPAYFEAIRENLIHEFAFPEVLAVSTELKKNIQQTTSVCLNVRRTDFLNGTFNVIDTDYYVEAEKILRSTLNKEFTLFIFSDDLEWCKQNLFKLKSNLVFVDSIHAGNKYINYLYLMSLCTHFIIPNSTFGWWAAWLSTSSNKKYVIAPNKWFKEPRLYDTRDRIPSDWIIL